MSALDVWRGEIFSLLPDGFLRRDQEDDSLFISDYPRRCYDPESVTAALTRAGFAVRVMDGLAHLDAAKEKYAALMAACPLPPLAAPTEETLFLHALGTRLMRAETEKEDQPLPPLRLTLKCLDAGDEETLMRRLPPMLARMQRKKEPLPRFAGQLILCYLSEKEASVC